MKHLHHEMSIPAVNAVLGVPAVAALYCQGSEKALRKQIERNLIPYHRRGKKIIFLRSELDQFFRNLPGCTVDEALKNLYARSSNNGNADET